MLLKKSVISFICKDINKFQVLFYLNPANYINL